MIDSNVQETNKLKKEKTYYYIFEENIFQKTQYDYLVITMDKNESPSQIYVQDITKKLNDYQTDYKLCCIVSDENVLFLVMYSENTETPEEEILNNSTSP